MGLLISHRLALEIGPETGLLLQGHTAHTACLHVWAFTFPYSVRASAPYILYNYPWRGRAMLSYVCDCPPVSGHLSFGILDLTHVFKSYSNSRLSNSWQCSVMCSTFLTPQFASSLVTQTITRIFTPSKVTVSSPMLKTPHSQLQTFILSNFLCSPSLFHLISLLCSYCVPCTRRWDVAQTSRPLRPCAVIDHGSLKCHWRCANWCSLTTTDMWTLHPQQTVPFICSETGGGYKAFSADWSSTALWHKVWSMRLWSSPSTGVKVPIIQLKAESRFNFNVCFHSN